MKENNLNKLDENKIELYFKKNYLKLGLGSICLGIAIFPNGMGFWAYPLAFSLLGISFFELRTKYFPEFIRITKNKILRRC